LRTSNLGKATVIKEGDEWEGKSLSIHSFEKDIFTLVNPINSCLMEYHLLDVLEPVVDEDLVNNPMHYGTGEIECIDYLKDNMSEGTFQGYLEGNTKKYLHRWRYKGNPLTDLKKSRWYLDRLIKELEN
jgi:hypothetical protein